MECAGLTCSLHAPKNPKRVRYSHGRFPLTPSLCLGREFC